MKRAKIMLSALAVLAVVGSALAFKANNAYLGNLRCTTDPADDCTISTYTTAASGETQFCTLIALPLGTPCVEKTVVFNP